jgi:hypothetical protein
LLANLEVKFPVPEIFPVELAFEVFLDFFLVVNAYVTIVVVTLPYWFAVLILVNVDVVIFPYSFVVVIIEVFLEEMTGFSDTFDVVELQIVFPLDEA